MNDAPAGVGSNPDVGLVLAGGGARGAYEAGALAVLLPYLEQRGERPGILLGTSIGALNATFLGATAHLPAGVSMDRLQKLWHEVQFSDIVGPLVSKRELGRVLLYVGGLLGIPQSRVPALFDTTPLPGVLRKLIDFPQLHRNIDAEIVALAVAAASYALGDSVVFHEGPPDRNVEADVQRAIRYVPTRIDATHVQASASIPGAFPATHVSKPAGAAGWYGDGGIRLNTPIKPALKLGAKRVVIVGLNSSALPITPQKGRPDIFDGAATYLQALFADPLAQDVATLASSNKEVALLQAGTAGLPDGAHQRVPYIFVAPRDRLTVGQLAADVFKKHLTGIRAMLRARDMATLGHIIGAGTSPVRGELFSLLFFATEFHEALIELGRSDAQRWLGLTHDEGPWRLGDPPLPAPTAARRPAAKRSRKAKVRAAA
jgi:NTE family protein